MRIKVVKSTNPKDWERVEPNFIYNRFDLFAAPDAFETVQLKTGRGTRVLEYQITGNTAELGIWLMPITVEELEQVFLYIATNHKQVQKITYKNGVIPYGWSKTHNHFRIEFPKTVEEMEHRISSKSRAKMRKKLHRAEEAYGKMQYLEYDRSNMPEEVVEKFFEYKLATRNRQYNMTPAEYLDRYHVSHSYVLKFGETYGAIRFSCEQCPVVYGENFTFNPDLQEYSLGRAIFMHHLIRMVEKKHPQLFFAGGNYEYKTHYGSIEETLYDCVIKVEDLDLEELKEKQSLKSRMKKYYERIFAARESAKQQ